MDRRDLKLKAWYWYGNRVVQVVGFPPNNTLVEILTYNENEMEMKKESLHISYLKQPFMGVLPKLLKGISCQN